MQDSVNPPGVGQQYWPIGEGKLGRGTRQYIALLGILETISPLMNKLSTQAAIAQNPDIRSAVEREWRFTVRDSIKTFYENIQCRYCGGGPFYGGVHHQSGRAEVEEDFRELKRILQSIGYVQVLRRLDMETIKNFINKFRSMEEEYVARQEHYFLWKKRRGAKVCSKSAH